jgi:hypothetical protein
MRNIVVYILLLVCLYGTAYAQREGRPKNVRYDLYVKDTLVNFTGKKKRAIAINGSIPAPTLVFTEGDTAEHLSTGTGYFCQTGLTAFPT